MLSYCSDTEREAPASNLIESQATLMLQEIWSPAAPTNDSKTGFK